MYSSLLSLSLFWYSLLRVTRLLATLVLLLLRQRTRCARFISYIVLVTTVRLSRCVDWS